MAISKGVFKQLAYKKETTFGTAPGASGAQLLRRVTSTLALTKDTIESNEIRPDQQRGDYRHGTRRVGGSISGELSPKTYADFFGSLLRRDFAAVSALTGLSITIAASSIVGGVQTYTVTRSAGDFLAGGVKIGHVIRLSAGSFNAANLAKNLLVIGLTATVATVITLNRSAMVAEGPIASSTVTVTGKTTFTPTTGHTDQSYGIEEWFGDNSLSELYLGCKIASATVNLAPNGMAQVDFPVIGQDLTTAGSRYFTSPTAVTATAVAAATNGYLVVNGVPIGIVTGLQFTINGNLAADPVVGSAVVPEVMVGRLTVSGSLTVYFDSATLRDLFIAETEVALIGVFTSDNTAAADFVTFVMPRIKLTSNSRTDGQQGITQTMAFEALFNSAGGTGVSSEQTTLLMQDSAA